MKKLFLIITELFLTACGTSKFNQEDGVVFSLTDHMTIKCLEDATQEEMAAYAQTFSHPEKSSYFYFFKNADQIVPIQYASSTDDVYKVFETKPFFAVVVTNGEPFVIPKDQFYSENK